MRIAWLSPYPINLLTPEIKTNRNIGSHAASWIVNLSNELAKQNDIKLHIITHTAIIPYSQTIVKNNITFHVIRYCFPFIKNKGFPSYLPFDKLTLFKGFTKKALRILKRIQPDIVHAHGTEGAYALTAYKSEFPSLISIQGIIFEYNKVNPSLSYRLQIPIERYTIKRNKNFGCRTNWDKNFILSNNKNANIFYVPEAISNIFFKYSWEQDKTRSILFVGYLSKRKGIEILLKSISIVKKRFPEIILKVVGTGKQKYLNYLKELTKQLNIGENVIWYGSQNAEQIAEHLSKSTIFVLPTFIDNSPNSLAEAMAIGTPCIASRVGGVPSMINDGVDGLLVEAANAEKLANKIITLLENKKMQIKISKNAKATAIKRNLPEKVCKTVLNVYKEIINNAHRE